VISHWESSYYCALQKYLFLKSSPRLFINMPEVLGRAEKITDLVHRNRNYCHRFYHINLCANFANKSRHNKNRANSFLRIFQVRQDLPGKKIQVVQKLVTILSWISLWCVIVACRIIDTIWEILDFSVLCWKNAAYMNWNYTYV